VALYDTDQTEDGTFYLVEEFIPGQTLASRLSAGRLRKILATVTLRG
jgi:hypothetical protein